MVTNDWCITRLYNHSRWLEASNFGFRKKRDYTLDYVAKKKHYGTADLCLMRLVSFNGVIVIIAYHCQNWCALLEDPSSVTAYLPKTV